MVWKREPRDGVGGFDPARLAEGETYMTMVVYEDEVRLAVHDGVGAVEKAYVLIPDDDASGLPWLADRVVELAEDHGAKVILTDGVLPEGADHCDDCGRRGFRLPADVDEPLVLVEREEFPMEVVSQTGPSDPVRVLVQDRPGECIDCGTRRRRRLRLLLCDRVEAARKLVLTTICDRCLAPGADGRCPFCGAPVEDGDGLHLLVPYSEDLVREFQTGGVGSSGGDILEAP